MFQLNVQDEMALQSKKGINNLGMVILKLKRYYYLFVIHSCFVIELVKDANWKINLFSKFK